jgi:hypothetical protein
LRRAFFDEIVEGITMKLIIISLCVATAIGLTACSKEKPAPQAAVQEVTSIEAQNREVAERMQAQKAELEDKASKEGVKTERQRVVDAVLGITQRWIAEYPNVLAKTTEQLQPVLANLRAIRSDLNFVPTSSCTRAIQSELGGLMDGVISALDSFRSDSPNPVSAEFQSQINKGANGVREIEGKVRGCLIAD